MKKSVIKKEGRNHWTSSSQCQHENQSESTEATPLTAEFQIGNEIPCCQSIQHSNTENICAILHESENNTQLHIKTHHLARTVLTQRTDRSQRNSKQEPY